MAARYRCFSRCRLRNLLLCEVDLTVVGYCPNRVEGGRTGAVLTNL